MDFLSPYVGLLRRGQARKPTLLSFVNLGGVQHLSTQAFELDIHRRSTIGEREKEVVIRTGVKLGLRILAEVAIDFQAGVEVEEASGELGVVGEVAEAGDEGAAFAEMLVPCAFGEALDLALLFVHQREDEAALRSGFDIIDGMHWRLGFSGGDLAVVIAEYGHERRTAEDFAMRVDQSTEGLGALFCPFHAGWGRCHQP